MSRPLLDAEAVYRAPSGKLCMWLASVSPRCRDTEVMFRYVKANPRRPQQLGPDWANADGFNLSAANLGLLSLELNP